MATLSSIHEGTISARPFQAERGRITGSQEHCKTGTLHGSGRGRTVEGNFGETTQSAQAELGGLISQLGALESQAQSLPLSPPSLPGLPQNQGYQPQPADYAFGDGAS